jgi:hydrogenase maturation protease
VDATPRGDEPGTIYTIEPDLEELNSLDVQGLVVETHGMNPMKVLAMVKSMGGEFKRILLVGCEPATLGPAEGHMGLSEPVEAGVDKAVDIIESIVSKVLNEKIARAAP